MPMQRMTKMEMNPSSSHCARSMPIGTPPLEIRQVGKMINVKSEVVADHTLLLVRQSLHLTTHSRREQKIVG
jgi:hypothetical protein